MGFWADKMNGGPPVPPPTRYAPHQQNLPQGMGMDHERAMNHYLGGRGLPQNAYQTAQVPQPPMPDQNGYITVDQAIRGWKGDPRAGLSENSTCPACGSFRYFQRTRGAVTTQHGVVYPRPECFECGYPTEQGALGISASTTGSSIQARQGAAPTPDLAARMG
jgi:hypothetical protein